MKITSNVDLTVQANYKIMALPTPVNYHIHYTITAKYFYNMLNGNTYFTLDTKIY
jgi:hypothetical protein